MAGTGYLIRSSVVGALAGLIFGFDTAVIAGTTHALVSTYGLSPAALGFTVSSALWGTVLSSMLAGIPGERIGARQALRVTALLYIVSALGCALACNWWMLIFFRFIGGLGIGASSVLGPVYIAELAPARWRGRLVGLFQINVVVGILLAYLSNYLLALQHLGPLEWRCQLGVAAVPAAVFMVMLFAVPRSPRWLVTKNQIDEARSVLQSTGADAPEEQLAEIIQSLGAERFQKSEPLFQRKYLRPILLAISIGMFNQLAGINAILYYLNDIFAQAGYSKMSGEGQAVIVGATNLIFTLIAMAVIDRFGRKPLLLIGAAGTAICLFGVAAIFFSHSRADALIWLLMAYIGFFALSQGSVIWVYISEIFPTRVRSRGQSLGSSSHWVMNALISGLFPVLAKSSGGCPFAFFGLMMIVQFFVVLRFYPETRGMSLEQLQHRLGMG